MENRLKGFLDIPYRWSVGPMGARFFDGLKREKKILWVRCPSCRGVLVPPMAVCGKCSAPLREWVELPDVGEARTLVPYLLEYPDQRLKPPIIFAKILLDGASVTFQHVLRGLDARNLPSRVRVRARWRDERIGSLEDIECFEPIDPADGPG